MWQRLAKFILHRRVPILIGIILLVIGSAYLASQVRMSYRMDNVIPQDHPQQQIFKDFRAQYGEDGNMFLIGIDDKRLFELDFYNEWYALGESLKKVEGVEGILSVAHATTLLKDTANTNFKPAVLAKAPARSQLEVDSLKALFLSLPFYDGRIHNAESGASVMGVTINDEVLNTKVRIKVMGEVLALTDAFAAKNQVDLRYSGLPYLRIIRATSIRQDIIFTAFLSVVITAFLLLILFRSFKTMLLPMTVVLIGLLTSLASIVLLGYEITILTGLVPSLIVVISVPDCVYLINSYHHELKKHGDKQRALETSIEKIGYILFFANLTTAIGFTVFAFMDSELLQEFGVIAGLNIALLFFVAVFLIPTLLSFMKVPNEQQLSHIDSTGFHGILERLVNWVSHRKTSIQVVAFLIGLITIGGIYQIKARGYLFDDVPKTSKEYKDLKFFEQHFKGTLPLEIVVDTRKKSKATKSSTLKRLDKVQALFAEDTLFGKPLSMAEGMKFASQAFYNGKPAYYKMPNSYDNNFITKYLAKTKGDGSTDLFSRFTDSTQQVARISIPMADVGSHEFPAMLDTLEQKVGKIFKADKYDVKFTGTSMVSYVGYNYIVNGLIGSVSLAFILIACVVSYVFRSWKVIMVALVPNMLPLLVTASLMGYFDIFLKPSTVLIFSVAFGISVDFTLHFLAKFRLERQLSGKSIEEAVHTAVRETGRSMIYTALILFFGFSVFFTSSFEGTFYLGLLTSVTIITALLSNLILLPSILMRFADKKG